MISPSTHARRLSSCGASCVDRALLFTMARGRKPASGDWIRVRDEIDAATVSYARHGYFDRPSTFHAEPAPLRPTASRARVRGLDFEWLTFDSEYTVDDDDDAGCAAQED